MINFRWLMEDWFWSMANFFLLAASAWFVYSQIKLQGNSNIMAAFKDLDERWSSKALLVARMKFCEKWLAKDHDPDPIGEYIAEFFELLAIYTNTESISNKFLWDTFSYYIENYYLMLHNELVSIRVSRRDPSLYTDFEGLYKKVHEKSREEYAPTIIESNDLEEFAKREIGIATLLLSYP